MRSCFHKSTKVQVLGQGSVSLEEVQTGQRIRVAEGRYEPVAIKVTHSDSHLKEAFNITFMRDNGELRSLILTTDHYLHIHKEESQVHQHIPSREVGLGDKLRLDGGKSGVIVFIERLSFPVRDLVNIYTPSGTFLANGDIVASCKSELDGSEIFTPLLGPCFDYLSESLPQRLSDLS